MIEQVTPLQPSSSCEVSEPVIPLEDAQHNLKSRPMGDRVEDTLLHRDRVKCPNRASLVRDRGQRLLQHRELTEEDTIDFEEIGFLPHALRAYSVTT